MVECGGLENRLPGNPGYEGSNPSSSARSFSQLEVKMEKPQDNVKPKETVEAKWRLRAFRAWAIVGVCIIIGILLYIAGIIWQAVAVLIVTALLVFLLHGFVNRLERHGIPRWGGTTIAFLLIIAVIIACFMVLIPAVVSQLTSFTQQLPRYLAQIQDFVTKASSSTQLLDGESINALLTQAATFVRQQAGALASGLANGVMGGIVSVGNIILITFISFICSFWILLDLPVLSREVRGLVDDKYQDDIDVVTNAFGTAVYGWAKSTLLCALITGVASWLCFLILGIPYSVVLGFLCGILYFVPYIGPMVSCAIVAIIALFVSPLVCIISIVVNMVINNVIGNIVSPKLMKSSVNVYPALILIAILVGSALGGIPGMLLSIPVIGALQGIFIAYFELITGKKIATEDGALFQLPKPKKSRKRPKFVEKLESELHHKKDSETNVNAKAPDAEKDAEEQK